MSRELFNPARKLLFGSPRTRGANAFLSALINLPTSFPNSCSVKTKGGEISSLKLSFWLLWEASLFSTGESQHQHRAWICSWFLALVHLSICFLSGNSHVIIRNETYVSEYHSQFSTYHMVPFWARVGLLNTWVQLATVIKKKKLLIQLANSSLDSICSQLLSNTRPGYVKMRFKYADSKS